MLKVVLVFLFLGIAPSAMARETAPSYSAKRDDGQDWQERARLQRLRHRARIARSNAEDSSVPLSKLDLSSVIAWKDYAEIENFFKVVRDERFITDPSDSQSLRRPSWMYPDDGCFARAHLMEERFEIAGQKRVKKIFVFGNLNVKTDNSLGGKVTWWYHVAPIVSDGTDHYVIDPAISPSQPLKLEAWLERMGKVKNFTMAICDSETYTPYEDCIKPGSEASVALEDQMYYLDSERERLLSLGRDVQKELGDEPPWLRPVKVPVPLALP